MLLLLLGDPLVPLTRSSAWWNSLVLRVQILVGARQEVVGHVGSAEDDVGLAHRGEPRHVLVLRVGLEAREAVSTTTAFHLVREPGGLRQGVGPGRSLVEAVCHEAGEAAGHTPVIVGEPDLTQSAQQYIGDVYVTLRFGLRIKLQEKGIPRRDCELFYNGIKVGRLTSGTFSPLLKTGIGMGYVGISAASVGTQLQVKIRENKVKSVVVEPPFYDTTRYGLKRIA